MSEQPFFNKHSMVVGGSRVHRIDITQIDDDSTLYLYKEHLPKLKKIIVRIGSCPTVFTDIIVVRIEVAKELCKVHPLLVSFIFSTIFNRVK